MLIDLRDRAFFLRPGLPLFTDSRRRCSIVLSSLSFHLLISVLNCCTRLSKRGEGGASSGVTKQHSSSSSLFSHRSGSGSSAGVSDSADRHSVGAGHADYEAIFGFLAISARADTDGFSGCSDVSEADDSADGSRIAADAFDAADVTDHAYGAGHCEERGRSDHITAAGASASRGSSGGDSEARDVSEVLDDGSVAASGQERNVASDAWSHDASDSAAAR